MDEVVEVKEEQEDNNEDNKDNKEDNKEDKEGIKEDKEGVEGDVIEFGEDDTGAGTKTAGTWSLIASLSNLFVDFGD